MFRMSGNIPLDSPTRVSHNTVAKPEKSVFKFVQKNNIHVSQLTASIILNLSQLRKERKSYSNLFKLVHWTIGSTGPNLNVTCSNF